MSNIKNCHFCEFGDPKRTKGNKIRCTRWSTWVDPSQETKCYIERFTELVDNIRKDAGLPVAEP